MHEVGGLDSHQDGVLMGGQTLRYGLTDIGGRINSLAGHVENEIACAYAMRSGGTVGIHFRDGDATTSFARHALRRSKREPQGRSPFTVAASCWLALSKLPTRHLCDGQCHRLWRAVVKQAELHRAAGLYLRNL